MIVVVMNDYIFQHMCSGPPCSLPCYLPYLFTPNLWTPKQKVWLVMETFVPQLWNATLFLLFTQYSLCCCTQD